LTIKTIFIITKLIKTFFIINFGYIFWITRITFPIKTFLITTCFIKTIFIKT
jgi:hypothetical protein